MEKVNIDLVGKQSDSLREAFGKAITDLAETDNRIVVLDADIAGGTGAHHFRSKHPQRFFQFGIAEQNMMAASAGFAITGLVPFVTTFAVFCIRAIEQVRLSIAYSNQNVKIIASHTGVDVGPDGASAQAIEDLAMFRSIPNIMVVVPADRNEMRLAVRAITEYVGPVYMRTGRSSTEDVFGSNHKFVLGKGQILLEGTDATIIACGPLVHRALQASNNLRAQGMSIRVVNMPTIKPIDRELVVQCARETGGIISAEDHNIIGGLGSAIAEVLVREFPCYQEFVGINDVIGCSGEPFELISHYFIDVNAIESAVLKIMQKKNNKTD